MQTHRLLPERLNDKVAICDFVNLMRRHGALGYGDWSIPEMDEKRKYEILHLMFGLIPRAAVQQRSYDQVIKPFIRQHLKDIGIEYDDTLLNVIKAVADQYFNTSPFSSHYVRRKYGISDIRASKIYSKILVRQNNRCTVCGADFNHSNYETLDHIIPWRLIGDVPDGSNWQFLCAECNSGKSSLLSIFQMPEVINWRYGIGESDTSSTLRVRYSVLCRDKKCTFESCENDASNAKLFLSKVIDSSLPVHDFYKTVCEVHADGNK